MEKELRQVVCSEGPGKSDFSPTAEVWQAFLKCLHLRLHRNSSSSSSLIASMLHTTQSLRRVGAAGSRAGSVQCNAGMVRPDQAALGRRAMLMGTAAPLLFTVASPALALILVRSSVALGVPRPQLFRRALCAARH